MKVQMKNIEEPKQFKPFCLKITVESLDELKELWCRLNLNDEYIKSGHNTHTQRARCLASYRSNSSGMYSLWEHLNQEIKQYE